jgi:hypothetical protein
LSERGVDDAVAEMLNIEADAALARVLAFEPGPAIAQADAAITALTPEQRETRRLARVENRQKAAGSLFVGASPWFCSLVARKGLALFADPDGALLRDAMQPGHAEALNVAGRLADHLLERKVDPYLATLLVECWTYRKRPDLIDEVPGAINEVARRVASRRRRGVA